MTVKTEKQYREILNAKGIKNSQELKRRIREAVINGSVDPDIDTRPEVDISPEPEPED